MTPTGLLLALLLPFAAAAPSGEESSRREEREAIPDPWGQLDLAQRLAEGRGREDEIVAVLVAALEVPETREEAARRLGRVLLASDPRNAWLDAYNVVQPHLPPREAAAVQFRCSRHREQHCSSPVPRHGADPWPYRR